MYLKRLSLTHFRNYAELDIALPQGLSVFQGSNAGGKTSLLEAIFLLATTKSHRTSNDRELISWSAHPELGAPAFSRVEGEVERTAGSVDVEVILARDGGDGEQQSEAVRKRLRVNHAPRRAADLIGQINAVLFSPQDLEIISGSPALRRRYLDIAISQIDPRYFRALQQYRKVVLQRNHLLRQGREARPSLVPGSLRSELAFWNDELVKAGSFILTRRQEVVSQLNRLAPIFHRQLTGEAEELRLAYEPSFALPEEESPDPGRVQERFRLALEGVITREVAQGISLRGPHRDDLRFLVDNVDLGVYGSRGQQRTVTLVLKLAEAELMAQETGETPILLLDDLLSELDAVRREHLLRLLLEREQQVLITATDLGPFGWVFLERAQVFRVKGGRITTGAALRS
jgi:DNA replication and repair protein RecF